MRFACILILLSPAISNRAQTWEKLNAQAEEAYYAGEYSRSFQYCMEALEFAKREFGIADTNYATSLNLMGVLHYVQARHDSSLFYYLLATDIRKNTLGKRHALYGESLNNLADLYDELGNYELALSMHHQALEVRGASLGKAHQVYGESLNNLAHLYKRTGQFEKALPYAKEALNNQANSIGKTHPHYPIFLHNLGSLYLELGQYEKALPLLLEAVERSASNSGEHHPDHPRRLTTLAYLYDDLGQHEKALSIELKAMEMYEKHFGKAHPLYASSVNNVACYYREFDKYEQSLEYYQKALDINKKIYGESHAEYATSLHNVGGGYSAIGEKDKALSFYLESAGIIAETLGKSHPDYADFVFDAAMIYKDKKDITQALAIASEAMELLKIAFGAHHPEYIHRQLEYAELLFLAGRQEEALSSLSDNIHALDSYCHRILPVLSEREKAELIQTVVKHLEIYYSCGLKAKDAGPDFTGLLFNNSLTYKNLILSNTRAFLNHLRDNPDTNIASKASAWLDLRKQLSGQYSLPASQRDADADSLGQAAERIEGELVRASSAFAQAGQKVNWRDVQNKLGNDEAAIEFVHFRFHDRAEKTDSVLYAAFIISPGSAHPEYVYLFEEKELLALITKSGAESGEFIGQLYASTRGVTPANSGPAQAYGDSLYRLTWLPLERYLQNVKKIFYSPSGLLHTLSLTAIPLADSRLLSDKYELVCLSSVRNVASGVSAPQPKEIVLFGGIEYDHPAVSDSQNPKEDDYHFSLTGKAVEREKARNLGVNEKWNFLPATLKEARLIQTQFEKRNLSAELITGKNATEREFKSFSGNSPAILHVSTHGFFFEDIEWKKDISDENVFRHSENPLLRSGLVMAGGNYTWQYGSNPHEEEDGILTSYEISLLDLSNTSLAVLSACETGLGVINGTEGVFGLQRAFKTAGVESLIMSLWKVPDKQTMELMNNFYKYWLSGNSMRDSFRKAQAEMRKSYDPYYWAAFVLVE